MHAWELALSGLVSTIVLATLAVRFHTAPARVARRALRAARVVPIVEASSGPLVKVVGLVRPVDALAAGPISGRRCIGWDVHAVEVRSGRRTGGPKEVRESACLDFVLEDASGVARVRGADVKLALARHLRSFLGELDERGPAARAYVASIGWDPESPRLRRFREAVLEPGARVALLGVVRRDEHGGVWIEPESTGGVVLVSDDASTLR